MILKYRYFDLEITTKEIITVGLILGSVGLAGFGLGFCFRDLSKSNKKRNHKKKENNKLDWTQFKKKIFKTYLLFVFEKNALNTRESDFVDSEQLFMNNNKKAITKYFLRAKVCIL